MITKSTALALSAALAAFGLTCSAQAQSGGESVRQIPVKKLFPYYDLYLSLPPLDRDGFTLDYLVKAEASNVRPRMVYALGLARTPLEFDARGKVLNMPDMAMLRQGKVEVPATAPAGRIILSLEAIVPLARTIPASAAANPVLDYSKAIGRAGPLALAIPKLTGIAFKGVNSGQVVFADGRRVSLPVEGGAAVFRPNVAAMRGAVTLEFPSVPREAEFAR